MLNANNTSGTTETTAETSEQLSAADKLQELKVQNFAATDMENAEKALNSVVEICAENEVEPVFNFDTDKEFPAGFGLSIIPLTKRVTGAGNVVEGVVIAAIPSVESILEAAGGLSWVHKLIGSKLVNAVKTAASSASEDGGINSLPLEINDFISSTRTSALAGFNAVAQPFVKALRERGLKFINKNLLRQILSSQAFAEQQYKQIPSDTWEGIIKAMIAHATKEGHEAGAMAQWLKTRDQVEVELAKIDLSGLTDMLAGEEDEATEGSDESNEA